MRKIYSLVLMTAMLLIGTNSWADGEIIATISINGGSPKNIVSQSLSATHCGQALRDSFATIQDGQSATITLTQSFSIDQHITITSSVGKDDVNFLSAFSDTYHYNENGVKVTTGETHDGVRDHDNLAKNITFDLGTNTLTCPNDGCFYLHRGSLYIKASKSGNVRGKIECTKTDDGYPGTVVAMTGIDQNIENFTNLRIGENVALYAYGRVISMTAGLGYAPYQGANNGAGMTLEIESGAILDVYKKYGVQIMGTIEIPTFSIPHRKIDGMSCPLNAPYMHIANGVQIHAGNGTKTSTENKKAVGVYAAGWGYVNIDAATISSEGTGVYIKGGQVSIDGANISSDGVYADLQPTTTGAQASGTAIIVESNDAYQGQISVEITGDTQVSSEKGSAIQESVTTADESEVQVISIVSGTFEGGTNDNGDPMPSVVFADETVSEGNIDIEGGNYNSDITTFLPDNGIVTQTEDENGNTTYVISTKPSEAGEWETDINDASEDADHSYVKLPTTTDVEVTSDKTMEYLVLEGNAKVTVKDNATLSVGEIVMSANSQIIVKVGSRLIVTGTNGIVANKATNILIETSETNSGIFMLDPSVTANRRPHATVQFFSKSWRTSNTEKVYQFFGLPATDITSFVSSTDAYQTAVYRMGGSSPIGIMTDGTLTNVAGLNSPYYIYYMLSTNDQDNKMTYTMQGKLLGNTNPVVDVESNWSPLANSYTGKINIDALLEKLATMHETTGVEPSVYAYTVIGAQKITWNVVNKILNQLDELNPMQPLMLMNRGGATTLDLNYQDLVWDPVFGSSPAPARHIGQNNMTKAIMRVTAEDGMFDKVAVAQSEDFTADYEAGYDAEKYMNEGMNIYVTDNVRLNVLASDNINNTYLGFQCAEAGTYTLSFDELQGENLVLVDLATGARMAMVEGAEYQFYADANEANDYRFEVVTIANMPTEIETIENGIISNIGAVYTVLGQYVGTMADWQNLPNGIYVVDGEKRVK